MVTKPVIVLPYDNVWEQNYIKIKDEIQNALGKLSLGIEHVGSTSVRGLSAKPIIDVDVIIRDCFGPICVPIPKLYGNTAASKKKGQRSIRMMWRNILNTSLPLSREYTGK